MIRAVEDVAVRMAAEYGPRARGHRSMIAVWLEGNNLTADEQAIDDMARRIDRLLEDGDR